MRIISGDLKGRKIFEPTDRTTRPLKDLVKESIFNIVMHSNKISIDLKNSNILDLFSGVGSFGIEALSRGSKYVTFIENYTEVLQILRKNIQKLNLDNKCEIISEDIINKLNFKKLNNKFELIFLDPPFDEKNLNKILVKIYDSKILKKNGILIIHRKINTDDKLIPEFNLIEEKKYGLSKIMFGNFL